MVPRCLQAILGIALLVSATFDRSLTATAAAAYEEYGIGDVSLERGTEIYELEYEDNCGSFAKAEWNLLRDPTSKEAAEQWTEAALDFGSFKKNESQDGTLLNTTAAEGTTLGYKLSVMKYPGDAALDRADYSKLLEFVVRNRALQAEASYSDGTRNLSREEVDYLLSHNAKAEEKLKAWTAWHGHLGTQLDDYSSVLQLAQKAASANDQPNVRSYWEMLTGEANGYESFSYQMDRVNELRERLMNFARKRLAEKYPTAQMSNDSVPAHLLGSLMGNDWTHLALDVVPHPDVIIGIRENLWKNRLMGKLLYKSASDLSKRFLGKEIGKPETKFWSDSNFRANCPARLVKFCESGQIRVSTCNEPSLTNYLDAHKNAAKILLKEMSSINPILNDFNRHSVLETALSEFFSILAASPAWLRQMGLIDETIGKEEAKITSLAITALDVLPRLAYYYSADKWRLDAIERNESDPKALLADWWKNRLQNEYVTSSTNDLPTFLSDDVIVNNQPYLSKALGIALAFQFYERIFDDYDVREAPFDKSSLNKDLIHMVQNHSDNWKMLVEKYMDIRSVTLDSLDYYFTELDQFFQSYEEPSETRDYNAKEIELEQLESKYRKVVNTPTTTTTTTTSTTTTTTTTTTMRPLVHQAIPDESSHKSPATTEVPEIDDNFLDEEDEQNRKPKINTSKAAWAVAAVLVATLTICIIAIFGKRRCSAKTPKNRRYV